MISHTDHLTEEIDLLHLVLDLTTCLQMMVILAHLATQEILMEHNKGHNQQVVDSGQEHSLVEFWDT